MRTVLDVQFFQCVGERRAVSWYRRCGALDQRIVAREGPAADAAEAARSISKALYEGYWDRCFRRLRGRWGRVGHGFEAVQLAALVSGTGALLSRSISRAQQ